MSCWAATFTNTMAAASLVSKLTDKIVDKLSSFVCGFSLPMTYDSGGYFALPAPSPDRRRRCPRPYPHSRSWSSTSSSARRVAAPPEEEFGIDQMEEEDEYEDPVRAMSSPRIIGFPAAESATVPCVAFQSQHGYKLLPLAGGNNDDDESHVLLRPVLGRRMIPSPHGGAVLAVDAYYNHPCQLIDPFTGAVIAPLPDLPLPRSETEPVSCASDEPRPPHHRASARPTDDGLAWDWSPRGVMVARGDTAFFLAHGADKWTPVHQSWRGAHMTVNHCGGKFFLLELCSLLTTVIDAATLRECDVVPPPDTIKNVDAAYLVPSDGGDVAFLLVHRAGDRRCGIVSEVYRAWLHRRRAPRWRRVEDVGDRAVFVDRAHGFTVRAGPMVRRNHMYVPVSDHPAGDTAVEYDVGVVDLRWPERQERMWLNSGEVERAWGRQPYWIVPKDRRVDDQ